MRRRSTLFLLLSAASLVLFPRAARAHDYGQVRLAPLGFEVTQSVQTLPQVPGSAGIGLSAHKPTVVRAYLSATRYRHLLFFHVPDFTPISVNGTLTVTSVASGTTLAVIGASNGPISIVPFASPNPVNGNSSLNFNWSFPPSDDVRFDLHLTTSTPTITAVDPAAITRTFVHNRRLSIRAVRLQFTDPLTGVTESPAPALVANGKDWFVKTGPLAPCKLYYWNDPTPVTIGTDLNLSCPGTVLVALDLLKNLGSLQFDNVYGWYQGALPCNGLSMPPASCAAAHTAPAYGNTELVRYQRTFTHEIYHDYWQEHRADGFFNSACDAHPGPDPGPAHPNGEVGVVAWDTTANAPVPATRLDVMVAGQLTADAWQDPARYAYFWNLWQDPGPESLFDYCHPFTIPLPKGEFHPFGVIEPTKPGKVILINGIIDPNLLGTLWPSYQVVSPFPVDPLTEGGMFGVLIVGLRGEIVDERTFDAHFQGDSREITPYAFSFRMDLPADPQTGELNLSEIRLVRFMGPDRTPELLDVLSKSPNLPAVQILAPLPGRTPVLDKPFDLMWEASDADGGELYASVQYSPDNGATWSGIGANLEDQNSLMFDPTDLPGGSQVLFRVIVSDGVNTGEAVAGPFGVPRKPPSVEILSPAREGDRLVVIAEGAPTTLVGAGTDPDDGVLPSQDLRWSSDLQGDLGAGSAVEVRLRAGTHQIMLTGMDSDGRTATADVAVLVIPAGQDSDRDGTPDYVDLCPNDPGSPENSGCPYDPRFQPVDIHVVAVNPRGTETQTFSSFFDVFFDVFVSNPRPDPVSIRAYFSQLTDPAGAVGPMFEPVDQVLAPGETGKMTFSFFQVHDGIDLPPGPYSIVFEAMEGPNSPLGRAGAVFNVVPNLRQICVGSAFGEPGERVTVPLTLDNGDGVAGFQADLGFDPTLLNPVGVRLGADTTSGGWFVTSAMVGFGQLRVLGSNNPPAGLPAGPRQVALVDFDLSTAAPYGPLAPFSVSNCILSDAEGLRIPCEPCPEPGRVTVRPASSFRFRPIDSPVGVDEFDPLPFPAGLEALTSFGAIATAYGGTADLSVGPLCGGTLSPSTLAFSSGVGSGLFRIACCLDPLLPMTRASLQMQASDPSIAISGTSAPFLGVAKADVNADDAVNVLDVTRAVNFALNLPVPGPPLSPPLAFQKWAANMLDQTCAVDAFLNVLDVVRIRNKALMRPPLCPCGAGGAGAQQAALPQAPVAPLVIDVVRAGPQDYLVTVRGAADLSGLQIDLRGSGPRTKVSLAGLTAGTRWQATTTIENGLLRILAFSNDAAGLSGDGAVLRLSGGGRPRIDSVLAADSLGRQIPVRKEE